MVDDERPCRDRESIIARRGRSYPTEDVWVPEWGTMVRVRTMTAAERDEWEISLWGVDGSEKHLENVRARLIVRTARRLRPVADETGAGGLVYDDAGPFFVAGDEQWLADEPITALQRLYNPASRLNALSARDLEELARNLGAGRSGASTSTSPGSSE